MNAVYWEKCYNLPLEDQCIPDSQVVHQILVIVNYEFSYSECTALFSTDFMLYCIISSSFGSHMSSHLVAALDFDPLSSRNLISLITKHVAEEKMSLLTTFFSLRSPVLQQHERNWSIWAAFTHKWAPTHAPTEIQNHCFGK